MRFEDIHPESILRCRGEHGTMTVKVIGRFLSTGAVKVKQVAWTHSGYADRSEPFYVVPDDLRR